MSRAFISTLARDRLRSLRVLSLPVQHLADGRTGARRRVLVRFNLVARSFFAGRTNAEPHFLLFGAHLDDLEVVLRAWL